MTVYYGIVLLGIKKKKYFKNIEAYIYNLYAAFSPL